MNGLSSATEGKPSSSYRMALCVELLTGFTLYRNDFSPCSIRTCYGTAVYIKNDLNCTEIPYRFNVNNGEITVTVLSQPVPYRFNVNNVEITVTVLSQPVPNIHVVGI